MCKQLRFRSLQLQAESWLICLYLGFGGWRIPSSHRFRFSYSLLSGLLQPWKRHRWHAPLFSTSRVHLSWFGSLMLPRRHVQLNKTLTQSLGPFKLLYHFLCFILRIHFWFHLSWQIVLLTQNSVQGLNLLQKEIWG